MKIQELNKLYHCVYRLDYHLVIVTKYRRKCLTDEMRVRAREIFESTLNKWGCELLEANGEPDHMHLLISAPPTVALSKLVNNLKTVRPGCSERSLQGIWHGYIESPFCGIGRTSSSRVVVRR
jgi:REP element-mobilizing transposase RayT